MLNDEFNVHDMDLGPETDVDTCDDVDFRINNNLIEANNSCSKEIEAFLQEKGALDLENQMDEERDDTPTPPAKDGKQSFQNFYFNFEIYLSVYLFLHPRHFFDEGKHIERICYFNSKCVLMNF